MTMKQFAHSRLCLCVLLLAVSSSCSAPVAARSHQVLADEMLQRTIGIIDRHYWRRPVPVAALVDGAVAGLLDKLNELEREELGLPELDDEGLCEQCRLRRHRLRREFNVLLDADDYKMMRQELAGGFSGIGAVIKTDDASGYVLVQRVLAGSPSQAAGLADGDLITTIDGRSVRRRDLGSIVKQLRGRTGTSVTVQVLRQQRTVEVRIKRGPIVIPNVEETTLGNGVGYLRLRAFNGRAAQDMRTALAKLIGAGAKKLVLDVRNNPGGRLDSACQVSDLFLPRGTEIVGTKAAGKAEEIRRAKGQALWQGPVVCLINEATASGAEILAGAIRAASVALIAGRPSFGKDSVQTIFKLPRSQALKLSTTRLVLRGPLDGPRLVPDVTLPSPEKKAEEARGGDVAAMAKDPWVQSAKAMLQFR